MLCCSRTLGRIAFAPTYGGLGQFNNYSDTRMHCGHLTKTYGMPPLYFFHRYSKGIDLLELTFWCRLPMEFIEKYVDTLEWDQFEPEEYENRMLPNIQHWTPNFVCRLLERVENRMPPAVVSVFHEAFFRRCKN
jgi:hypothetical protein